MIANAQLDNERASHTYQIQLLKDKLEEMEETHAQLQREHKDKCRDHDALKRNNDKLTDDLKLVQGQLNERDTLIAEYGLTIVVVENEDGTDAKRALVSVENAHLLDSHQGSLGELLFRFVTSPRFFRVANSYSRFPFADVRLKKFTEEKNSMKQEIEQLHQQLLEAKTQRRSGSMNGPCGDEDYEDAQRMWNSNRNAKRETNANHNVFVCSQFAGEANKLIADYKFKLTKAEQEIASLQASLARSETQVIRYKSTADATEKAEADLKIERRKLQREVSKSAHPRHSVEHSFSKPIIFSRSIDWLLRTRSTTTKSLRIYYQPLLVHIWDECHLQ